METREERRLFAHWRSFWSNAWLLGFVIALSALVAVLSLTLPFFMLLLFDRVINARSLETLWSLAILALFSLVVMGVFDYARRRILARFAGRLQEDLEPELIAISATGDAQHGNGLGTNEIDALRAFVHSGAVLTIIDVLWIPLFVLAVYLLNPVLGTLAIAGGVGLVIVHFLGQWVSSYRWLMAGEASRQSQSIQKNLSNAQKVLRGQRFGEAAANSYLDARSKSRNAAILASDISVAFRMTGTTMRWIFSILALCISSALVLQNQLTAGGMIAATVLLGKIFLPLVGFLQVLPGLTNAVRNWNKIGETLKSSAAASFGTPDLDQPAISLRGVTLKDDIEGRTVLSDVNLDILSGKLTQITGVAGSGKTLLADLLVGARQPAAGRVTSFGAPFAALNGASFDKLVGYIPELPSFLNGTIAENISGLESVRSNAQIEEAAFIADLHARTIALPKSYETKISSSGQPLSRGMRDLIALARAVYHKPAVVVVDEPSASLIELFTQDRSNGINEFLAEGGAIVLLGRNSFHLGDLAQEYRIETGRLVPNSADNSVVLTLPVSTRSTT